MPTYNLYPQYSGIWPIQQVNDAIAAGTWPGPRPFVFGSNSNGQFGNGTTTNSLSPVQIGTLVNWSAVNAGYTFTTAIKTDGTLWTWGSNASGQLGLGNTTAYSSPKQVGSLTNWAQVANGTGAGGGPFVIAVKTNGTLWSWGQNSYGQLGQNNTTFLSSPVQIGALTTWARVAAGANSVLAVKTDGTLWAWGRGTTGVLGLGNLTYYSSPKQVGLLTNWSKISIDVASSFAIKTDGTLWSWGRGVEGELGLGNTTSYSSPKQVGALTTWLQVSSGGYNMMAIKTDGTLWGCGQNAYGKLGLGNTTYYSSPKQVGALTNWSQIALSNVDNSCAIKTDGTLWAWGQNQVGQLGFGNVTNYSSPKQVGTGGGWLMVTSCYKTTTTVRVA